VRGETNAICPRRQGQPCRQQDLTDHGRNKDGSHKDVLVMHGKQIAHDDELAPLLTPSLIVPRRGEDGEVCEPTRYAKRGCARLAYLDRMDSSRRRHRKFCDGFLYNTIFVGFKLVESTLEGTDIVVTLQDGTESMIRIRRLHDKDHRHVIDDFRAIQRTMGVQGNVRGAKVGDMVHMYALGQKSTRGGEEIEYSPTQNCKCEMQKFSETFRSMLEETDYLKDQVKSIDDAKTIKRHGPAGSFPEGPGVNLMVTKNIGNSGHYDTSDDADSVARWVEDKPGHACNWFFVLPNVSIENKHGVVIRIQQGTMIGWDGRNIYHCSSVPKPGPGNDVWACMVGSLAKR
jgi:hypothetical protein